MKLPQISTPDALKKKPSLSGVKGRDLKNIKVPDFKNLKVPDLTSLKVSDLVNLGLGRSAGSVVGLDIQPGFIAAVQGRGNGSVVVEKAAAMSLSPDTLRHGEVNDEGRLAEALRELFGESGLSKRVRVGIANQRTVLRTLELPPVTDAKELAAAVNFQAQEQVPMPLNNAVLDFHALGVVNTPAGPRQQVVLVAAQRDMVERLLGAIEQAGLTPVGIDLSAFALIRSLYAPGSDIPVEGEEGEGVPRVLYLNVDGLTNLAIAEGPVCRFTRVVGGGIESSAAELAAKREISTPEARALLFAANLAEAAGAEEWGPPAAPPQSVPEMTPAEAVADEHPQDPGIDFDGAPAPATEYQGEPAEGQFAAPDQAAGYGEQPADSPAQPAGDYDAGEATSYEAAYAEAAYAGGVGGDDDEDVYGVLESGIRDIYGEVRNSLDFHRSQEGGGDVSHVVLSGAAQDIPGFADALQAALGLEVRPREVELSGNAGDSVSAHRLAVAAGLAVEEVVR
jgi:type IV pilus assembly protein PilM